MKRKFELRMAGQVLVLLPVDRKSPQPVECLVVGGRHRPILALPMGKEGLVSNRVLPNEACVFLDANSAQYAMIDVTGFKLEIGPPGPGVSLGALKDIVDLQLFTKPLPPSVVERGGVAAEITLTNGTIEQRGIAGKAHGWWDGDKARFDQEVSGELSVDLGSYEQFALRLKNGFLEYHIVMEAPHYDREVVMFLTSLCGWDGSSTKAVDFDEVDYVLPHHATLVPRDIEFYGARVHPKTGNCPPKIITVE